MNMVSMIKNLYSYDQSFKLWHQSSFRDISYYMRQNLDLTWRMTKMKNITYTKINTSWTQAYNLLYTVYISSSYSDFHIKASSKPFLGSI